MSSVTDALFGGSSRDAARAQQEGLREAQRALEQAQAQARSEMLPRFDEAMDIRRQGAQQALNMFNQGFAPSIDVFQQGSNLGQQTLQTGAQQAGAAILGGPIDYSALAPRSVSINPSSIFNTPAAYEAPPAEADIGTPPPTGAPANPGPGAFNPNNPAINPALGGSTPGDLFEPGLGGVRRMY